MTGPKRPDNYSLPLDLGMVPDDARILVALSGGADSMALLLALRREERDIVAAHVNHGLRGEESDGDERFVLDHCRRLGIAAMSRKVTIAPRLHRTGTSPESESASWASETDARDARYDALASMAHGAGCRLIATGHTADDTLETMLINMVRGAAVDGLGGIPHRRELGGGLAIVRPLWAATRAETQAACVAAGWQWREDSSNFQAHYLRNRLRAGIVPAFAAMAPGGAGALARQAARSAAVLRQEHELLDSLAREALKAVYISHEANRLTIDGLAFTKLQIPLQRRLLRLAAADIGLSALDTGFERIEEVRLHIVKAQRRAVWCWPDGVRIEWTGAMAGNRIRLWRVDEGQGPY